MLRIHERQRQRDLEHEAARLRAPALDYDDVVLIPRHSRVDSRKDVSTRSHFTRRLEIENPVVSANMDTITTAPMAIAMAWLGAIGVIHRFLSIPDQVQEVVAVKGHLGTSSWRAASIEPHTTVVDAREQAERMQLTLLLVATSDSRLLGTVAAHDLATHLDREQIQRVMTPIQRVVTADPSIRLDEGRQRLRDHHIEELPLVDRRGLIAGLLTARDFDMRDDLRGSTLDAHGRLAVAASIGIRGDYLTRAEALLGAGADALVLDVANGHSERAVAVVREVKAAWPEVDLVAGNVVTASGIRELASAGADAG